MSRTVTIPDALYTRLENTARAWGFSSIAQLMEVWQSREDTLRQRQEVVAQIDAEHEKRLVPVFRI